MHQCRSLGDPLCGWDGAEGSSETSPLLARAGRNSLGFNPDLQQLVSQQDSARESRSAHCQNPCLYCQ